MADLIKRTKKTIDFTIVDNDILRSKEMSFAAKGLLCYILSLPDDWILYKTQLMKEFNVGRKFIDERFKEIETAGHLVTTVNIQGKDGKFTGNSYLFYDKSQKQQNLPLPHLPLAAEPLAAKEQLLSTNKDKELIKQSIGARKKSFLENPPSVEDVVAFFKERGYTEEAARTAHRHYELGDWHDTKGKPVLRWKQKMATVWFKPENKEKPAVNPKMKGLVF